MRLENRSARVMSWVGVLLGLFVCSLPLAAMAVEFKPPRRGVPGRREGGGTRDPRACIQGNPARLAAIMPETNLGLTTTAYPRFFWYMPKTRAKFAEFALFEVNEKLEETTTVYKTTFSLAGTPGVASLALPAQATLPPLTVGKDYRWSLKLICNPSAPNDSQQNPAVNGFVQRVEPDATLSSKLAKADPRDRVALYANNGIWFDTITTLAELRCARPQDTGLAASWSALMKSVKLDVIAEQPLIQQCGK